MRTRILIAAVAAATAVMVALAPATALAAGGSSTSSSVATAVAGGWSQHTSAYIGKYKVVPAATPGTTNPVSSPPAGVFSLAIRAAAQLGAASGPVSSGQLVTFLRKVKTGEPLSPSGILSLFGPSGTQLVYLTDMNLHGAERVATVNGGSFLGVPIGTFTATVGSAGTLSAVIKASGLGTADVRLVDFIAAPPSS